MAAAVRAVHAGEILLPMSVVTEMVGRLSSPPVRQPLPALTARELEVLHCLARGSSGQKIAGELAVSADTVRTHVQAIRRKLGAHSRLEAVAIALEHRLIEAAGR